MAWTFYTEQQRELALRYRQLAKEHILPRVREVEENDRVPADLIEKLLAPPFSLSALSVPEHLGGPGFGKVEVCIVAEEIGYVLPCLAPFLEVAQLYSHVVEVGGAEEQQALFLKPLTEGAMGCYSLTDEGPGSDPAGLKTTARPTERGFVLRGTKRLVTFAETGDLFAVFANEDPSLGPKGISAFVLEKGMPGIKLARQCKAMGLRGHRSWEVELRDVEVPLVNRIGGRGDGLRIAFKVLNTTRISLSFGYVGLARAALDLAIEHAKTRMVGGKPIGRQQAVSFPIAEVATEVDAARLLAYRAAVLSEQTGRHRKETSMAKAYAADAMIHAVDTANRVLGGYGGDIRYGAERYLRDAYTWIAAQGTPEVQKVVTARELLRGSELLRGAGAPI
jgi:alkylation response protein AidB-like acyl-CoA dehydrogenase